MPSYRVDGVTLSLNIFEAVGEDGKETVGFIAHVGLAKSSGPQPPTKIAVLHMGPPLHGQDSLAHIKANAVGSAAVTDDEVQKIKTFIDRQASEHSGFLELNRSDIIKIAPQMYCVHPHASPFCEEDGRYVRMRYSCAGFVFEAYKKAGIALLRTDALPMADMDAIKLAYPRHVGLMERERLSPEALGLGGDGPWPVLLCGYLFHALNRDADSIRTERYKPSSEDGSFI